MDLFGKKRIAELEKENKKLQEEKDGALMLKDTTIKNHEQLVHKYRSLKAGSDGLKAVMESKNKKVRELELENRDLKINFDSRERALKTLKDDKVELSKQIRELDKEIIELEKEIKLRKESSDSEILMLKRKLDKYESVMAYATCSSMNDFRLLRGKVYNSSKQNKRIRNKCIMKLADQMEKIFKEIME